MTQGGVPCVHLPWAEFCRAFSPMGESDCRGEFECGPESLSPQRCSPKGARERTVRRGFEVGDGKMGRRVRARGLHGTCESSQVRGTVVFASCGVLKSGVALRLPLHSNNARVSWIGGEGWIGDWEH